jgi:hypothetical protein
MLNIANGSRPVPNICYLPEAPPNIYYLLKSFRTHKNLMAVLDLEPVSDRKVKLLQKQTIKPFSYYSLSTFTVYF